MNQNTAILTQKIRALDPEQVREVEDFIDFLRMRAEERGMTRTVSAASTAAFERVWANPEDDAYDAL